MGTDHWVVMEAGNGSLDSQSKVDEETYEESVTEFQRTDEFGPSENTP